MKLSRLGALVKRVISGRDDDPDKIRMGVMGALGHAMPALSAGGAVELRWLDAGGGKVACRVVVRTDKPHITLFSGEGAGKHAAGMVVWVMVQSAVGHSTGTPWAAQAVRLAEAVTERLRGEGLMEPTPAATV